MENGCEKETFISSRLLILFNIVLSIELKEKNRKFSLFLTDKKNSTCRKIDAGVFDFSEGKRDITKKVLKENEKVNINTDIVVV